MGNIRWHPNANAGLGTSRADWLDMDGDASKHIAALEAAAGYKGDWEMNDFGSYDWWGLAGTYKGEVFTVYTYKSGYVKIGAYDAARLDLAGLKSELLAIVNEDTCTPFVHCD